MGRTDFDFLVNRHVSYNQSHINTERAAMPEFDPIIHQQLGELIGEMRGLNSKIDRLQEVHDIDEEKADASRAAMHRRLDETTGQISSIRTDIVISNQLHTLMRVELEELGTKVDAHYKELEPQVRMWMSTRKMGITLFGLLSIGGFSVAGLITYFGHAAWAAVRDWLRGILG